MENRVHPADEQPIKKSGKRRIIDESKKRDVIANEMQDSRDVKNVFKKYPLLPYAGDNIKSGDSLMQFFFTLAKLSVTDGSCIHRIGEFVIGDKIKIKNISDEFITEEEVEVTTENVTKFKEVIQKGKIEEGSFGEMGFELYKQFKICGHCAILLSFYTTGDIKTFTLRVLDNNNYRILLDKEKRVTDYFVISEKWEEKYLDKNPPKIVGKFPLITEDKVKGVEHTIIYAKHGTKHYGRPDSIFGTQYKYSESQNVDYRITQTDNRWTGDLIIEAEQGDPNTNQMMDVQTYENNFSNKSENPLSVFYTERPFGAGPLFVYQLTPNSNENWYKTIGAEDRIAIISSHGWSERLLGHPVSGGINGNSYFFELYTKLPLIDKHKNFVLRSINTALTAIFKFIDPSIVGLGIDFYSTIIEKVKTLNFDDSNNNAKGSNQMESAQK